MQYQMTAERSEAASPRLRVPSVRDILEIARTFAAAPTGGEEPREKMQGAAKPHRRKPQKSPEKHRLEPCGVGEKNFLVIRFQKFIGL